MEKKAGEFVFAGAGGTLGEKPKNAKPHFQTITANLEQVSDRKLHDVYIVSKAKDTQPTNDAALTSIQFFTK